MTHCYRTSSLFAPYRGDARAKLTVLWRSRALMKQKVPYRIATRRHIVTPKQSAELVEADVSFLEDSESCKERTNRYRQWLKTKTAFLRNSEWRFNWHRILLLAITIRAHIFRRFKLRIRCDKANRWRLAPLLNDKQRYTWASLRTSHLLSAERTGDIVINVNKDGIYFLD